jgi:site-specific DNA-methyltransferase (cytosine-N4-specific)
MSEHDLTSGDDVLAADAHPGADVSVEPAARSYVDPERPSTYSSRSNIDTEILEGLIGGEKHEQRAHSSLANATFERVKAARLLLHKKETSIPHGDWTKYLKGLAAKMAECGYPATGKPYSTRWFQVWMDIAEHFTDEEVKPVSHLGMKEIARQMRKARRPKSAPATGDAVHGQVEVLLGDCRDRMKELLDESVHCVITSLPFYHLVPFAVPDSVWDGDPACDHDWEMRKEAHKPPRTTWNTPSYPDDVVLEAGKCRKCSAWLGQLGWEPSREDYIRHVREIFRGVRRVLKETGFILVNIGDKYEDGRLLLIPDYLAIALDADGWFPVNEIVWHKVGGNSAENVTKRFARNHEDVLLFAKNGEYEINRAALREPCDSGDGTRPKLTVWSIPKQPTDFDHHGVMPEELARRLVELCPEGGTILDPFGGVGTTGLMAQEMGRNAILIEASPKYAGMTRDRLKQPHKDKKKSEAARMPRKKAA